MNVNANFKDYRHRRWWSEEEKQRIVHSINQRRREGATLEEACRLERQTANNYCRWSGQFKIRYHRQSDNFPPHIKITAKETAATESLAALLSSFVGSTKVTIQIIITKD